MTYQILLLVVGRVKLQYLPEAGRRSAVLSCDRDATAWHGSARGETGAAEGFVAVIFAMSYTPRPLFADTFMAPGARISEGKEVANQPIKMDAGSKVSLFFASLALLVVVVFLVSQVIGWLADMRVSQAETVSDERVEKRIEPIGEVVSGEVGTSEEPVELAAGDIYNNVCSSCHDAGVSGAPVMGDSDAWSARFDDKGLETLFDHAINGFNAMPARGGDSSLSDEQVRKTVAYMLEEADIEHGYEGADNGAAEGEAEAEAAAESEAAAEAEAETEGETATEGEAPADTAAAGEDAAAEAEEPEATATADAASDEGGGPAATIPLDAGDPRRGQGRFRACVGCHGPHGQGTPVFPALAGKSAEYIAEMLVRYRAGERVGDQTALMAPNAARLSDQEIADLAVYVATFEG